MKNKIITALSLFALPLMTFAQAGDVSGRLGRARAPIETLSQARYYTMETAVNWLIGIFWVLAVGFVIWTAFLYLTAGENEDKLSEAKKRLVYALVAAMIALLASGIRPIAENLLRGQTGNSCQNYTNQIACEQVGCGWRWVLFTGYRCR